MNKLNAKIIVIISLLNKLILCQITDESVATFNATLDVSYNDVSVNSVIKSFNITKIYYKEISTENSTFVLNVGTRVNNLSACTNYEFLIDYKDVSTNNTNQLLRNVTTLYKAPEIKFDTVKPTETGVSITWNLSNENCLEELTLNLKPINPLDTATSTQFKAEQLLVSTRNIQLNALNSCQKYEINLTVRDKNNATTIEKKIFETLKEKPSEIQDVRLAKVHTNNVTIAWDYPEHGASCVRQYNLKYSNCLGKSDCSYLYSTVHGKKNQIILKNLEPCTRYYYQVFADSSSSDTDWSFFSTCQNAANPVRHLVIESPTDKSAKLKWDPPEGNEECVMKYEVSYSKSKSLVTNETEITVDDLLACQNYTFTVKVMYSDGQNSTGVSESVQIIETNITKVQDLQITEEVVGDLSVSWKPPERGPLCVRQYKVVWWFQKASNENSTEILTSNTFISIKNNYACAEYTARVFAISISNKQGRENELSTTAKERVIYKHHIKNLREKSSNATQLTLLSGILKENRNLCTLKEAKFICRLEKTPEIFQTVRVKITNNQEEFEGTVKNLTPFSKYQCSVRVNNIVGWSEESAAISFATKEDFASPPINVKVVPSTHNAVIHWLPPVTPNGIILNYQVYIRFQNAKFTIPPTQIIKCPPIDKLNKTFTVNLPSAESYHYNVTGLFPYFEYRVQIAAVNGAGVGQYSDIMEIHTLPTISEHVNFFDAIEIEKPKPNEDYASLVVLQWFLPCRLNGKLKSFQGFFRGTRKNWKDHSFEWSYKQIESNYSVKYNHIQRNLKPEYTYTVTINVSVEAVGQFSEAMTKNFDAPSGFPEIKNTTDWWQIDIFGAKNPTKSAEVQLSKDIFKSESGTVQYAALMVHERKCQQDPEPKTEPLDSFDWPNVLAWYSAYKDRCVPQYQTTPKRWTPQVDVPEDQIRYVIGAENCENNQNFCNGPLKSGTEYGMIVRLFTTTGFRDSYVIIFKTDYLIAAYSIILSVFACLLVAFILGMLILWRTNRFLAPSKISSLSSNEPIDVSVKHFPAHYDELVKNNNEKLNREFKIMNAITDELIANNITSNVAKLNESKNRYTNILAFDSTRVILEDEENDREDDCFGDYINASYIHGYKYEKEYIASQGPKQNTCFDFWRMVLQCNAEIIVMLTQLVESGKIKCHEYYPHFNQEIFVEDIYIKCSQEINLTTYKKRLFNVHRGLEKKTVVHYHYNKWPDHGCPENPNELIKFIKIIRQERKVPMVPMIIHCSAGVGRTGTFIALDITIQKIQNEKKINIYDTVKNLRKQRVKMVQTLQQYTFLYDCCLQLVKGKGKRASQCKDKEDDLNGIDGKASKLWMIKFPKNIESGLSSDMIRSYSSDDVECSI